MYLCGFITDIYSVDTFLEILCDPLPPPVYGHMNGQCGNGQQVQYGSQCLFSCPDNGFVLADTDQVQCIGNGHWSPVMDHGNFEICLGMT